MPYPSFPDRTPVWAEAVALLPGLNNMLDDDYNWKDHVNAGGKNISNLGVLRFGASGLLEIHATGDVPTLQSTGGAALWLNPASANISLLGASPTKLNSAVTPHTRTVGAAGMLVLGSTGQGANDDGAIQLGAFGFLTGQNYSAWQALGRNYAVKSTGGADTRYTPLTHAGMGYSGIELTDSGIAMVMAGGATVAGGEVSPTLHFDLRINGTNKNHEASTPHTTAVAIRGMLVLGGEAQAVNDDGAVQLGAFGFLSGQNWSAIQAFGRNYAVKSTGGADTRYTPLTHAGMGYQGVELTGTAINFVLEAGATVAGAAVTPTPRMILTATGLGIGAVPTSKLQVAGLPQYANNAAAVAAGLTAGAFYRTGADPDMVCVVHG